MTLVFSGIKKNLEENTIQMDAHMVEKNQVILQSDMNEKWRSIYKESDGLNSKLKAVLKNEKGTMDQFLSSKTMQKKYLEKAFPQLVNTLQYNMTSGIFLILANDQNIKEEASYQGFFVRDSNPKTKTVSNTDLMMEKGNKILFHKAGISLDNAWTSEFHFKGKGKRAADDFYYEPYLAALNHKSSKMSDLGYWAKPFVLEDDPLDAHKMITYSVPLEYNGEIYGVLGVEISLDYLNEYFSVRDLDVTKNAGYALLIEQENGTYKMINGKGILYDTTARTNKILQLDIRKDHKLYAVNNAKVGKQKICAIIKPLKLYSNNVPYKDTKWSLCGFVTEKSIYGLGNKVYIQIILSIIVSMIFVTILLYILIKYITKPVYSLAESVRQGVEGIHDFKPSKIREIDELHKVIESLTDTQKEIENQLLEEKERYKIAVESSSDMFFTYRKKQQVLEIVNSKKFDGVWECKEHPEYLKNECIHPDDRKKVYDVFKKDHRKLDIEFRLREYVGADYKWVNLTGSVMEDENGEFNRVVACVHNIQQHKMLEEAQKNKEILDSTTKFYRLEHGLNEINLAKNMVKDATVALIEIDHFTRLNEKQGLVFGDLALEYLSKIVRRQCKQKNINHAIYVRGNAGKILIWLPESSEIDAKNIVNLTRKEFGEMVHKDYLILNLKCGISHMKKEEDIWNVVKKAEKALLFAQKQNMNQIAYTELSAQEQIIPEDMKIEEKEPFEKLKQMSLSSIALNLFDRTSDIKAALDMLSLKLKEVCQLDNMIITKFNKEYLVNSLSYQWDLTRQDKGWSGIIHCNATQYKQFIQTNIKQKILLITQSERGELLLKDFVKDQEGMIFHMKDDGEYSGSILFVGISRKYIKGEKEQKQLEEIAAIIQNRINLERHDLLAQAKSDFLARMSHEIRTPMNGIIGMTEIALKETKDEKRREDCLRKIQSSSIYLLGILNDILDMSKIESGKMQLVCEENDINQMIDDLTVVMDPKMKEKNICFTKEIKLIHHIFMCDCLRLNQILMNFLSNAVKYCDKEGHIKLVVKETLQENHHSDLYFAVKDDGCGIPEEKQEIIFKRFEQADDSDIARRQGTGLGLAISNRLVHMMDSKIELDSNPGDGSTFGFHVRLQALSKQKDAKEVVKKSIDVKGKRILVVEDNELNMEIITTVLEDYKIKVEQASNGQEAVEMVQHSDLYYYDLIFMDIMMPVMDGLKATKEIRRLSRSDSKEIPIIAMSANAFDEDVKRSLASGMNGHLSKPIDFKKLEEILAIIG